MNDLKIGNFAFIDGNNIHLGAKKSLGWKIDYKRLRIYLRDKYSVIRAYYFIGKIANNEPLYRYLQKSGYDLVFKPTITDHSGSVKGNCDAELVLQAMIDYDHYQKAILVTGDGDFTCLAKYLENNKKLEAVIATDYKTCSTLLKRELSTKIKFLDGLKEKLSLL